MNLGQTEVRLAVNGREGVPHVGYTVPGIGAEGAMPEPTPSSVSPSLPPQSRSEVQGQRSLRGEKKHESEEEDDELDDEADGDAMEIKAIDEWTSSESDEE